MPYARPFTHTTSVAPQYTEAISGGGTELYLSAPQSNSTSGIFATFGTLSGYQWWNGPDEGVGYVIGRSVTTFNHSTPNGNDGNVKFWRTDTITESEFVSLGNRLLGTNYTVAGPDLYYNLITGPDGKFWTSYQYSVFIGGDFTTYLTQSHTRFAVIRSTDGQLDPHVGGSYDFFEPGFENKVFHIHHRSNGKMLVSGSFTQSIGTTQSYLVQLGTDGLPDGIIRSFDNQVYQTISNTHRGYGLGTDDGFFGTGTPIDIIAVGNFSSYDSQTSNNIVAIKSDGSKLTRFGDGLDSLATCIDADKKFYYIGGDFTRYDGQDFTYLGMLDKNDGSIFRDIGNSISLDDGVEFIKLSKDEQRLAVCGKFTSPTGYFAYYDIGTDTVDAGFADFDAPCLCVDFQSDGSLIIGGQFTGYSFNSCNHICKLDLYGNFDLTFNTNIGGGFNADVLDLRVLYDDSIIVVGAFDEFDGSTARGIIKLDKDGNVLSDWNSTILTGADNYINCVSPR